MRRIYPALPLTLALFLGACASAPAAPPPAAGADACREPVYLELKGEHPDSLSERAWERLQQLEAACQAEETRQAERPAVVDRGHHGAWLWMPAMMVLGGMMWLMMGGS